MTTAEDRLNAVDDPRGSRTDEEIGRAAMVARMFGQNAAPRIGRFSLLRRIGEGAMGSVWAAFDENLDRRVAVKLLHPGVGDDERLILEARRLASVNHPNVVVVYEVGVGEERVFIAMEFVDGPTLRGWAEDGPHAWSTILDMYLQAARGLAAAHEVGVVHRDFKPDNALVGADGRVRVADFGLADEGMPSLDPVEAELSTSTRRRGGTPAYMAPEQLRGDKPDGRADQFALCVSLFETLAGQRPFEGTKRDAPAMDRLPSSTPSWLRSALVRGLSLDRKDRFETMHDLVAALDSSATRSRRRRWVLGGVAVVMLGAIALRQSPEAPEACPDARSQLEGIWDDDRRDAVRTALTRAAPSYAEAMLGTIEGRLDAYSDAWVDGHRDACEATHVRREQSGTLLDARVRCLTDRRRRLDATVGTLVDADAKVAEKAVSTVEDLPAIAGCADLERVQALHPIPDDPKLAAAVDEQLEQMARARTLIAAGRYSDASEIAQACIERARELEYPPLSARAQGLLGWAAQREGNADAAGDRLETAYEEGRRTGQSDVAAEAAAAMAYVLARFSQNYEATTAWAKVAVLEAELLGRIDLQAAGLNARGIAAARADDLASAETYFEEAIELQSTLGEGGTLLVYRTNQARNARLQGKLEDAADATATNLANAEALLGPNHPGLVPHIDLLAELVGLLGETKRARELLERGISITQAALGAQHPSTARLLELLGSTLFSQGKLDEARKVLEQAVAITEAARAASPELAVQGLTHLGMVYIAQGEVEPGLELLRRNVAEQDRLYGAQSRDSAVARGFLARALLDADKPEEALPLADAAVKTLETGRGPDHVDVAEGLWVRGRAQAGLGQLDAAATDLERAIEIIDAGFRPGASQRAEGRIRLGEIRLRQGRAADAVELAERALDSLAEPPERAPAQFLLARALAEADRERALEAARAAETGFRASPTPAAAGEVAAWISANF